MIPRIILDPDESKYEFLLHGSVETLEGVLPNGSLDFGPNGACHGSGGSQWVSALKQQVSASAVFEARNEILWLIRKISWPRSEFILKARGYPRVAEVLAINRMAVVRSWEESTYKGPTLYHESVADGLEFSITVYSSLTPLLISGHWIAWMDSSNTSHQVMATQQLEDVLASSKPQQERRVKPQPEQALNCPRCDSTNTKFCYYNNYSLTQPRYFCKACRRYWTKGGSLRNIPVGGGCRKNKRSSSSKRTQDQALTTNSNSLPALPPLNYDSSDLTLAFSRLQKQPSRHLGLDDYETSVLGNSNSTHCDVIGNPNTTAPGFLHALRSGCFDTPNGFHNLYYGFGNGNMGEVENGGVCGSEGLVFPYEELSGATKQEFCNGRDGETRSFWGFPGQVGGDGNMGGLDSGRECWNGLGSSWHGLVNSPLM
ncbi:hypothetical protein HHK36_010854 [Tetracentron sinense]|uniref:Dof zinc finger protein n=1 Tax=Tetracentron sinense TaxID=13715 RepID=A0A834Z841_TETSI|nr:hypothetical protein HHK36_010854 [Tetracentron sinense]